jgi:predicted ATP-dependent Lon-type protease
MSRPVKVPKSDPEIVVSHISELTIDEWIDALKIAEVDERTRPPQD